jgi:hypothetical protein
MPFFKVPFTNTQQEKTFWCWAAVAANVYNSMAPPSEPILSQCDVAKLVQGPHACDGKYGEPYVLSLALHDLKIDDEGPVGPKFIVLESEFQGLAQNFDPEGGPSEPVCAEIIFPGAAHFVAVTAIDTDSENVWVADPFPGGNSVEFTYNDFVNNYNYTSPNATEHVAGAGTVQNLQSVVNKWNVQTGGGPNATDNNDPASAG